MCYFSGHLNPLADIPDHLLMPVRKKLQEQPDIWECNQNDKPNNFKVFAGNTQHLVLQFPEDRHHHWPSHYYPAWQDWEALLTPIIAHATSSYCYHNGRTSRIMLARLLPQSSSKMHIDHTPSADVPHKIHVPIQTHPDIAFLIENQRHHLPLGKAIEVNNKLLHGTHNPTTIPRIHLIFDYFDLTESQPAYREAQAS